jgi:DNA-binding NarL/FixJ family response regulator
VEDEPLVAMNLTKSLAELGFNVVGPYSTLAKAAAAAAEMEFDAALLDVNLSGKAVYPVADILASKKSSLRLHHGIRHRGLARQICECSGFAEAGRPRDIATSLRTESS